MVMFTVTACNFSEDYKIANKKNAVVAILMENKDKPTEGGVGTGFVVKENYIITNFHVAGDKNLILKVAMENNDEMYEAELVLGDKDTDVAVIKLKDWEKFKKENPNLMYLDFANEVPKATDTVWAIGHPWGLFWSISKGIISVEERKSPSAFPMWWIQTDAHVFQGNSGGPLLNNDGKVIGMNSVMLAKEGGSYGFAIPTPLIKKIITDLEKYKEVRWANIGISISGPGVTIKEIVEDGAAKSSNLKVGDQIVEVEVNNAKESVNTAFDLISLFSTLDYQSKIQLTVKRGEELITLDISPKFKLSSAYSTK